MGVSMVQSYGGLAGLYAAPAKGTAQGMPARSSASATTSAAPTSDDVLDLSAEGQAAADAAPLAGGLSRVGLFGVSPSEDGTIRLADLEAAQEKAQAWLQVKLKTRFASAGIDTMREIR
jgi:hypothetical protein